MNKRILSRIFVLISILGIVSCGFGTYPPGDLQWYPGLGEAMQEKDDKRPILLFFYSEYRCPKCDKAINVILTNPGFLQRSKHFRCVSFTLEEDQEMLHRFRVTALPAFLILDKYGNIREKIIGYDFLRTLALLERHIMVHQRPTK